METFLAQQQQRRQASNSNNADDSSALRAARAQFEASQQGNLTTQQRIAAEQAGCDTMLSGYFSAERGFHIVKDVKMSRPLLTHDGNVVPESYMRLSHVRIIGQAAPRTLHLYAHPFENLAITDLIKYLGGVVQDLGLGEGEGGVFGIATLGSQISFCQIGGVPHGHPGTSTGS
jgi:hypothetical protein